MAGMDLAPFARRLALFRRLRHASVPGRRSRDPWHALARRLRRSRKFLSGSRCPPEPAGGRTDFWPPQAGKRRQKQRVPDARLSEIRRQGVERPGGVGRRGRQEGKKERRRKTRGDLAGRSQLSVQEQEALCKDLRSRKAHACRRKCYSR